MSGIYNIYPCLDVRERGRRLVQDRHDAHQLQREDHQQNRKSHRDYINVQGFHLGFLTRFNFPPKVPHKKCLDIYFDVSLL